MLPVYLFFIFSFFKFSNFMWNEIITKSFRPTVLYINLGQIYNIQPCCNTYDPFVPFFVRVPGVLVPGQADRHKGLSWMTGEEYLLPTLFWYGHLLLHAHNKMSISEKKLHVNLTLIVLSKTIFSYNWQVLYNCQLNTLKPSYWLKVYKTIFQNK